jgi:hypothetical protein
VTLRKWPTWNLKIEEFLKFWYENISPLSWHSKACLSFTVAFKLMEVLAAKVIKWVKMMTILSYFAQNPFQFFGGFQTGRVISCGS